MVDKFQRKIELLKKFMLNIESCDEIFESVKQSTPTSAKFLGLFHPKQKFENCHGCPIHCKPPMKGPVGLKTRTVARTKEQNETNT